ncbi:Sodium/hydrogen exchanger 4 [Camellia lanceoleosa]|uniref:Sodium/hydrogen exchanger 4 n=1 Tax=Camellia lanceoleosa TaxID=1840588 RepID=A0ACC0GJE3_9ERIC|nr:Sodium/hydrogen exchanger 4 [Camellia lanceoleosa]
MAKFATICHSKQVNLDTGVEFNTSVARGLIEEAECVNANFLVVGHSRNRISREITRYCFEHALEGCSVVSVAKSQADGCSLIGFVGLTPRDYLAIGTIFSSTDTVCTLQVLHQDETPLLYSLVFSLSSTSKSMKVGTSSPKREGGTQIAQINNAPKVSGGSPHYNNGSIYSTNNLKGIMQSSSVSSPSSSLGRSTTLKKLSASKSDEDLASLRSPHFGVFL